MNPDDNLIQLVNYLATGSGSDGREWSDTLRFYDDYRQPDVVAAQRCLESMREAIRGASNERLIEFKRAEHSVSIFFVPAYRTALKAMSN